MMDLIPDILLGDTKVPLLSPQLQVYPASLELTFDLPASTS